MHYRVASTSISANQELAQEELAPVRLIESIAGVVLAHLDPGVLLAGFDPLPQAIVDDPKLRHLDNLARLLLVDPGDLLPRPGVFYIGGAVPLQPADVNGIFQETRAAVGLAANGGIAPFPARGPRDPFVVQPPGDGPRADASRIVLEDAADDGRFGLVDLPAPATGGVTLGNDLVAIGQTTGNAALAGAAELSAPDLLAQVRQVELGHGAQHSNVELGDRARGHGMNLDAAEAEAVVQVGDVGELAAQAVERLADDHIELLQLGVGDHLLVLRPEPAGPAQRPVGVDLDHGPALALGLAPADFDLVLDALLALQVAGKAAVDGATHGILL